MNLFHPSVAAHAIHAFIFLIAAAMAIVNFQTLYRLPIEKSLILVLLFSIVVGIHGISHLGLEINYGLEPFPRGYNCPYHRTGKCPCFARRSTP
jgi:hypothetical protein